MKRLRGRKKMTEEGIFDLINVFFLLHPRFSDINIFDVSIGIIHEPNIFGCYMMLMTYSRINKAYQLCKNSDTFKMRLETLLSPEAKQLSQSLDGTLRT